MLIRDWMLGILFFMLKRCIRSAVYFHVVTRFLVTHFISTFLTGLEAPSRYCYRLENDDSDQHHSSVS